MAAADLIEAAGKSYDNLALLWNANTLKTKLTAFWTSLIALFDQQKPGNRPISDWLSVIATTATDMPGSAAPYGALNSSAQYVYRLCWLTHQLQGQSLITTGQANAVLAAYNAQLSA